MWLCVVVCLLVCVVMCSRVFNTMCGYVEGLCVEGNKMTLKRRLVSPTHRNDASNVSQGRRLKATECCNDGCSSVKTLGLSTYINVRELVKEINSWCWCCHKLVVGGGAKEQGRGGKVVMKLVRKKKRRMGSRW